jgi:hypothetical protein
MSFPVGFEGFYAGPLWMLLNPHHQQAFADTKGCGIFGTVQKKGLLIC